MKINMNETSRLAQAFQNSLNIQPILNHQVERISQRRQQNSSPQQQNLSPTTIVNNMNTRQLISQKTN